MEDIRAVSNLNIVRSGRFVPEKPEGKIPEKDANINKPQTLVNTIRNSEDTRDFLEPDVTEKEEEENKETTEELVLAENLLSAMNNKLRFVADDRSRTGLVVQVVNNETGETVKQVPSEELLDMIARLKETATGVFVDDSA